MHAFAVAAHLPHDSAANGYTRQMDKHFLHGFEGEGALSNHLFPYKRFKVAF
jgi:hypothetical protein